MKAETMVAQRLHGAGGTMSRESGMLAKVLPKAVELRKLRDQIQIDEA